MKFITRIQPRLMALGLLLVTAAALAAGLSYRLAVDGLTCPFCAYGIEKQLGAIADGYNQRIQTFSADGSFLTGFGSRGDGPGPFDYAIALAVADDGTLFAVDFGNARIHQWRPVSPR